MAKAAKKPAPRTPEQEIKRLEQALEYERQQLSIERSLRREARDDCDMWRRLAEAAGKELVRQHQAMEIPF